MEKKLNKNLFLKISNFLVCLLPLALITGPAIPDFIVILSSIFFFIYLLNSKFDLIADKKFLFLLSLFYFLLVFSSLFSEYIWISLRFSLPYIRFIILAFLIAYLIKNNKYLFYRYFFISCSIALLILFFDSTFQFYNEKNLLGFVSPVTGRIGSVFKDELILGSYALKISPMFFTTIFALNINVKNKKKLFFIIYFIVFYIILISGDRAPLFLFSLYSVILFYLLKPYRISFLIVIIFSLSFFIIFLSFSKITYNRFITQTINELGFGESDYTKKALNINDNENSLYRSNKKNLFSAIHENYFITGLNIFKDNYLIGAGPKSFSQLSKLEKYAVDRFSYINHPHNFYIQLLAETGIAGFGFVFLFFFYLVAKYFTILNLYKKNTAKFELLIAGISMSGLIFHLWPVISTGSFFTNYNCILIYMCLGFFLGEKSTNYK